MFSPPPSTSRQPVEETVVAGYTLVQIIGVGGFSIVKKGVSSSGEIVAVKRVRRADIERQDDPDECRRQLDNEMEIWRSLNHEHVLPLFAVERTAEADYFITLFCPAGSLFDILKRDGRPALAQDDAGMLFRQVVRGLRYLHETAKLVHGDIKLENILVDDAGTCRITDFGLSRRILDPSSSPSEAECYCLHDRAMDQMVDRLRRYTTISHGPSRQSAHGRSRRPSRHRNSTPLGNGNGTPPILPYHQFNPGSLPYAAPEMLSPQLPQCPAHPRIPPVNPAQDMWALGVLLYALLTGHLPFNDNFEPRLQMKILHGAYDIPLGIGHGAESVLRSCLEQVVSDRWTIDMVDEVAWGVGWG
ncbi:kinase-like protein, partial [Fomitiporia mediterranea MF3/22]|uniref:kinase-like protein n=1 Tax=Fomitiporia mediterranea (strain MF3/22) TaxID=694068 RepID=UPI00044072E4